VKLPLAMMATARSQQANQPARAAVTAQLTVAIAILIFAVQPDQAGWAQLELLARLPEL
jgi:hypothetical protein